MKIFAVEMCFAIIYLLNATSLTHYHINISIQVKTWCFLISATFRDLVVVEWLLSSPQVEEELLHSGHTEVHQ